MNYTDILIIQDGTQDTFWGILIIIAVYLFANAFGALILFKKKQKLIHEAKRIAINQLVLKNRLLGGKNEKLY